MRTSLKKPKPKPSTLLQEESTKLVLPSSYYRNQNLTSCANKSHKKNYRNK